MAYHIEIHENFETIFDVEAALEEIKQQLQNCDTSGSKFPKWNLTETKDEQWQTQHQ